MRPRRPGTAGLVRAAKERVGSGANTEPALLCLGDKAAALLEGQGKRLLSVEMLAGSQDPHPDLRMSLRNGQVDDQVDRRVSQKGCDADGAGPELSRTRFGSRLVQISYRTSRKFGKAAKGGQVGTRDGTAADDPNAQRLHVRPFSPLLLLGEPDSALCSKKSLDRSGF
jgi:hypothetical protein